MTETNRQMIIRSLSHTMTAANVDRSLFTRYLHGEISYRQMIRAFEHNNMIETPLPISQTEFDEWLWTLGYPVFNG